MLSQIEHLVKIPGIGSEFLYIDPLAVIAIAPLGEDVGCRIYLHHATRFLSSLSSDEAARLLGSLEEETAEQTQAPPISDHLLTKCYRCEVLRPCVAIIEEGMHHFVCEDCCSTDAEWSINKPAEEALEDNPDIEPLITSIPQNEPVTPPNLSFRSRRMSAYDDIGELVDALEGVLKTTESEASFPDDPKTVARSRAEKLLRSFGRYPR